jgi:hypothetical protein
MAIIPTPNLQAVPTLRREGDTLLDEADRLEQKDLWGAEHFLVRVMAVHAGLGKETRASSVSAYPRAPAV